jgi:hypothetical protein
MSKAGICVNPFRLKIIMMNIDFAFGEVYPSIADAVVTDRSRRGGVERKISLTAANTWAYHHDELPGSSETLRAPEQAHGPGNKDR